MDSSSLAKLESEQTKRYQSFDQSHVFKHLQTLNPTDKEKFLTQLSSIPVEKLKTFLSHAESNQQHGDISPFSGEVGCSSSPELAESSRVIGLNAIAKNEVCAVLLAGGQGTRLGFDGPKGMYPDIGLPSKSTLFELVAARILKLMQLATDATHERDAGNNKVVIPWYIMTSPMNDAVTKEYFAKNDYFGLDAANVKFFAQGVLPCLDKDGKIILETAMSCAMAPDGNGGIYTALSNSGCLSDMEQRGIKYLHAFAIDNALVRPADPVFVGYCISKNADCGNKVLWKAHADEKVGVMAERNNKPCIIEYSDMDAELVRQVDDQTGKLVYGASNICNHFYTLDFIKNQVLPQLVDMYHVAHKKIPCWNEEQLQTLTPTSNNGIKLESFIFDVFPLSAKMAIWDVKREEEFAPVKNAPGSKSDSPDTARSMISDLAKSWVREAGGKLVGQVDAVCEVVSATSYAGEGMLDVVAKMENQEVACPFQL